MLTDCHTHLDQFHPQEIEDVISRAREVGVGVIMVAGTTLRSSEKCVELAVKFPDLLACVGLHPMNLNESVSDADYSSLYKMGTECSKVVSISEIGLDFAYGPEDHFFQESVFRRQIEIAKEVIQVGMGLGFDIEEFKGHPAEKWASADDGSIFEELDELFVTELKPKGTDHFSSMAQDTSKKRHSEIQYMNGFISNEGRKIGIPTPANDAVTEIISEIEEFIPTPENIQRALEMI